MGLYSQKILEAMKNINGPIKTTSTTTLKQPDEGLDIGSILTMLMMSQMFKQPKAPVGQDLGALGAMPSMQSWASVPAALGSGGVPGLSSSGGGLEQLLSALMSIGKII